ncbi:MAG TPA: EamA family transporter [Ornithinibacter sp.]|nr:EamA family transporter [Ornithinibacter sp.]
MPPRHVALAVLVAVVWGANFVVIDLGLGDVPPTLFVAVRFVVVLLPAVFIVPRPAVPWRDIVAVGTFMSLGQFALLYTALAVGMPAGLASLVLQAQVVVTALLSALLLHERPTRPQVVGILVGVVGLAVVAVGRSAATPALGLVLVVAAATSWAVGNVAARRAATHATPRATTRAANGPADRPGGGGFRDGLSMTVWSALVVPLPLFALAVAIHGPDAVAYALTHPTVPALLSTAYTAWLASLLGYGIWNTLLARHQTSAVVPFAMLVPVVGLTVAWLVQGELPNGWETAGGALLLLGVAVTTGVVRPRRPRRAAVAGDPPRPEAERSSPAAGPPVPRGPRSPSSAGPSSPSPPRPPSSPDAPDPTPAR